MEVFHEKSDVINLLLPEIQSIQDKLNEIKHKESLSKSIHLNAIIFQILSVTWEKIGIQSERLNI